MLSHQSFHFLFKIDHYLIVVTYLYLGNLVFLTHSIDLESSSSERFPGMPWKFWTCMLWGQWLLYKKIMKASAQSMSQNLTVNNNPNACWSAKITFAITVINYYLKKLNRTTGKQSFTVTVTAQCFRINPTREEENLKYFETFKAV